MHPHHEPPPLPQPHGEGGRGAAEPEAAAASDGDGPETLPPWKKKKGRPMGSTPPWKRKAKGQHGAGAKSGASNAGDGAKVVALDAPSPGQDEEGGFKASSTFKGERGGSAEDAELLALLRGVSLKSSGSDRFGADDSDISAPSKAALAVDTHPSAGQLESAAVHPHHEPPPLPQPHPTPDPPSEGAGLTRDGLEESLKDKSWKVRKAAYELLARTIEGAAAAAGKESIRNLPSADIMPSLDHAIPAMVKDSNAVALDAALNGAFVYAEYCDGATSADQARCIATALFKGSALSSSRSTTVKLAHRLPLKLMEVGKVGAASLHAVVEVLLREGLASRKPKVVLNSVNLVLDAATSFGAGSIPVAVVASSAPKILGHSNADVRKAGILIIAEICRALGSKGPLQTVMDTLKTSQMAQLDDLLEKQPNLNSPTVGLRSKANGVGNIDSVEDVLSALQAGTEEEEAKKLEARPAVNIFDLLPATEYAAKLKKAKWSEKTGALDILIECGGKQPYKLVKPSSTVSYTDIIRDLRKLLGHTHFAVNSKAMVALSMLAEGVGEKMFPNLRPMLLELTDLSKDKKLTAAVGKCLDSFFGNVLSFEHLLDKNDALPTALNEQKQKNALSRKATLEFIERCVARKETAGPRGILSATAAENVAKLASNKVKDSDAATRSAAMAVFRSLQSIEDEGIAAVVQRAIEDMKTDNPRAYKSLNADRDSSSAIAATHARSKASAASSDKISRKNTRSKPSSVKPRSTSTMKSKPQTSSLFPPASGTTEPDDFDEGDIPSLDSGLAILQGIPKWGGAEDDGGIFAGLKSSNWRYRKDAINEISIFVKSDMFMSGRKDVPSSAILVVVKNYTKAFQEVNFNVMKAIMGLLLALADTHAEAKQSPATWICNDAVALGVDKITDRKLFTDASSILTSFCVIQAPSTVSTMAIKAVENVKSPLPHEALLKWHKETCVAFGASALGNGVNTIAMWALVECDSTNVKVRQAASTLIGELHSQLGPVFKALLLSKKVSPSIDALVESVTNAAPFDPSAASAKREKRSIVGYKITSGFSADDGGCESHPLDLISSIPRDCIERMGSKDSKTAWKLRKEALDEVGAALDKCSGLIATTPQSVFTQLVELVRAMRSRLSDSQSNLKPIAAKHIGSFLSCCDKAAQANFGKLVFVPLISAAMSDNKKAMRETALYSLDVGTKLAALEGGGANLAALDTFLACFVNYMKESDFKATGLPEVLKFIVERAENLPKAKALATSKAQKQEFEFACIAVASLTSSKSETRTQAEAMLRACNESGALSFSSIERGIRKLVPAQQRSIKPIIGRIGIHPVSLSQEKENRALLRSDAPSRAGNSFHDSTIRHKETKSPTVVRSPTRNVPGSVRKSPLTRDVPSSNITANTHREAGSRSVLSDHPLLSDIANASSKESRTSSNARKKENWPEYPEEPAGSAPLLSLKRVWAPFLPPKSATRLFPEKGLQKQDDAVAGCQLLSDAITLSREKFDTAVIDQLDLISKWLACCLCTREATVGLQAILSVLLELFALLKERSLQLSDYEALVLLPIVLEKASLSKGRFSKMFHNLLSLVLEGEIFSPRRYGPYICILIAERSHHPKARGLSMKECYSCVLLGGLEGIGKKGIQLTAKIFSNERFAENKSIALDLITLVLENMNGDVQKYFRICGNSNLSSKGKQLIQERWEKHENSGHRRVRPSKSLRSSSREGNPTFSPKIGGRTKSLRVGTSSRLKGDSESEIPSLNLRFGSGSKFSSDTTSDGLASPTEASEESFTFTFRSNLGKKAGNEDKSRSLIDEWEEQYPPRNSAIEKLNPKPQTKNPGSVSENVGSSAAELRARLSRLRQIRDRKSDGLTVDPPVNNEATAVNCQHSYEEVEANINYLLSHPLPIDDENEAIKSVADSLRLVHAAATGQKDGHFAVSKIYAVKIELASKTSPCIELLTNTLEFGCRCGYPDRNSGMSIDLISLVLATIMAILREDTLSSQITQDALMLLIRQSAVVLLDPRLQAAVVVTDTSLDKLTREQIARAINKTAIQAAISAPTHVSVQALMSLQVQCCVSIGHDDDGTSSGSRLSKVVSKLMARVLKSEGSRGQHFSSEAFDMEAVLCAIEDALQATESMGKRSSSTCLDMIKTLLSAIIQPSNSSDEVRTVLCDLGMGPSDGALINDVLSSVERDIGIVPAAVVDGTSTASLRVRENMAPLSDDFSHDLATLINNVASAEEKADPIQKLQQFVFSHPNVDLNSQLSALSAPFRAFILERLQPAPPSSGATGGVLGGGGEVSSVQERLKALKAKVDTSEHSTRPGSALTETSSVPAVSSIASAGGAESFRERISAANRGLNAVEEHVRPIQTDYGALEPPSGSGGAATGDSSGANISRLRHRLTKASNYRETATPGPATTNAATEKTFVHPSSSSGSPTAAAAKLRARILAMQNR